MKGYLIDHTRNKVSKVPKLNIWLRLLAWLCYALEKLQGAYECLDEVSEGSAGNIVALVFVLYGATNGYSIIWVFVVWTVLNYDAIEILYTVKKYHRLKINDFLFEASLSDLWPL